MSIKLKQDSKMREDQTSKLFRVPGFKFEPKKLREDMRRQGFAPAGDKEIIDFILKNYFHRLHEIKKIVALDSVRKFYKNEYYTVIFMEDNSYRMEFHPPSRIDETYYFLGKR
jgi:predicted KAP-like P-loop ATPase